MHHERLIELVVVERSARAELDVDHRGHGERGEHLVRGLHGEDGGPVGHVVGNAHREAALVDLVKLGVGVPGFVEVNAGNGFGEFGNDFIDVVTEAIVGGVGNDSVGGILVGDTLGKRALVDDAADELRAEALERDEADHADSRCGWASYRQGAHR